jgi:urea carboxylase
MIRQAAGEPVLPDAPLRPQGAAIEVRIYAEVPHAQFRPSAGRLTEVTFPDSARVDTWVETGTEVTSFYDPMLAKIIVKAADRPAAIKALGAALEATTVAGIETNLDYLKAIAASDILASGAVATTALNSFAYAPDSIEVITPGAQSSVQELPGRIGLWHVGVPPSGPMDAASFRNANRLLGNHPDTAALELTMVGPTLRFLNATRIALAGAGMTLHLDGAQIEGAVIDVVEEMGGLNHGGFDLHDVDGSQGPLQARSGGDSATKTDHGRTLTADLHIIKAAADDKGQEAHQDLSLHIGAVGGFRFSVGF